MDNISEYINYGLMLTAYIVMAVSFSGVKTAGKVFFSLSVMLPLCIVLQMLILDIMGEIWLLRLYPLTVHFLTGVFIIILFGKKPWTVVGAVTTGYMMCQPSRWAGVLAASLTDNLYSEFVIRTLAIVFVVYVGIRYFSGIFSEIFNKPGKDVFIFSMVPVAYYIIDYGVYTYTGLWTHNNYLAAELAPVIISIVYICFCSLYYKMYDEKTELERRKHIVEIINEQQEREIDSITEGFNAVGKLREELDSFYDNIQLPMDKEDVISAGKKLNEIIDKIDCSVAPGYTESVILNYMLKNTKEKCRKYNIKLEEEIDIKYLKGDETLLTTIISNVLGNALKEQLKLPESRRFIQIIFKNENDRLIFSVINPYKKKPRFNKGIPYNEGKNRGYGTGGIAYLTEMAGGKCYFSAGEQYFSVKITI